MLQHTLSDTFTDKTLELFRTFKNNNLAEELYSIYYTQTLHKFAHSNEVSTSRFLYNTEANIMSIHYFEMQGESAVVEDFSHARKYVNDTINESNVGEHRVLLKRNRNRIRNKKRTIELVKSDIIYKIVKLNLILDWRKQWI